MGSGKRGSRLKRRVWPLWLVLALAAGGVTVAYLSWSETPSAPTKVRPGEELQEEDRQRLEEILEHRVPD